MEPKVSSNGKLKWRENNSVAKIRQQLSAADTQTAKSDEHNTTDVVQWV